MAGTFVSEIEVCERVRSLVQSDELPVRRLAQAGSASLSDELLVRRLVQAGSASPRIAIDSTHLLLYIFY